MSLPATLPASREDPSVAKRDYSPEGEAYQQNRALNESEMAQGKTQLRSLPLTLGVLLGHRCNLNCVMCGQRARYRRVLRRRRTELPDRVISEMLSLLPTAALLQVSGGEPLFYPAAARIVDAVRPYPQVRVERMTNGNLIDDQWINRFCAGTFRRLSISVDAATTSTYSRIRRGGCLGRVLDATAEIVSRRTHRDRPAVTWNFVVMRRNRDEILDFVMLAHEYGADQVSFTALNPQRLSYIWEDALARRRHASALMGVMAEVARRVQALGMSWVDRVTPAIHRRYPVLRLAAVAQSVAHQAGQAGSLQCTAFWRKMTIEADNVWACCWARSEFRRIPFHPERQSLLDVWNAPGYRRARMLIAAGRYAEVCSDLCPIYFRWKCRRPPSTGSRRTVCCVATDER